MGFAKKHPLISGCLLMPVFMLLCVVAFFAPAAIQNYRGVCLSEGRILTDEEKLERAVQHIIARKTLDVWVERRTHAFKIERYKNTETFLAKNPDCCQLNPDVILEIEPPDFDSRIWGLWSDRFLAEYTVSYYGDAYSGDPEKIAQMRVRDENVLTNCGRLRHDGVRKISP